MTRKSTENSGQQHIPTTLGETFALIEHETPTERTIKGVEATGRATERILAVLMAFRIVALKSNPGRYATQTGRTLSVVQAANKVGGEILRCGPKVTDTQAASVAAVNQHPTTRSLKVRDQYLTDANGGEPADKVEGPARAALYVKAHARLQAEAKAAKVAATQQPSEGGADGVASTEQPGRTLAQRLDAIAGPLGKIVEMLPDASTEDWNRWAQMLNKVRTDTMAVGAARKQAGAKQATKTDAGTEAA